MQPSYKSMDPRIREDGTLSTALHSYDRGLMRYDTLDPRLRGDDVSSRDARFILI